MQCDRHASPPTFVAPDDFQRARDVLIHANYTDTGILEVLATPGLSAPRASDVAPLLWRTRHGTALDTLIRLFLIGVPTEVEATRRALAPMTLEQWAEARLLTLHNDMAVALVKLLPFQDLVLAFDMPQRLGAETPADFVMGIGSSTLTLATLTIRRPSRLTLDLGAGCGIQAFLAAPHSAGVYAVDRNPRACGFADFNIRLNGLANVECYEGDLFEPVQQQQFDLVISNPPFVISPASSYLYRDSPLPGDEVCQKIVREVPRFLREGGYCQILCNWAHLTGQDWQARLASWFEGTGCDAWVLRSETREAADYAATWIRETEGESPAHVAQLYEEWMAYYEQGQIEAMSAGLITMRRRSSSPSWFRADDAPAKMLGPCGDNVVRLFEAQDFLETARDDRVLLEARLCISPDVRWEQHCMPSAQGWQITTSHVCLGRGLAYTGDMDPYAAHLVVRCDGKRPLRDILSDFATTVGSTMENFTPACLGVVRRLIAYGFLAPAETSSM